VNCEIYPCPECGGSGRIVYVGGRNLHPVVRCKDCGYTEDSYFGFDLESTAIQLWNERIMYRKWKRNCSKTVL